MKRRAGSIGIGLRLAFAAAACALFGAAPLRAAEPDTAETRRIMHEVFGALKDVLPLSLDEQRFADPAQRASEADRNWKLESWPAP